MCSWDGDQIAFEAAVSGLGSTLPKPQLRRRRILPVIVDLDSSCNPTNIQAWFRGRAPVKSRRGSEGARGGDTLSPIEARLDDRQFELRDSGEDEGSMAQSRLHRHTATSVMSEGWEVQPVPSEDDASGSHHRRLQSLRPARARTDGSLQLSESASRG